MVPDMLFSQSEFLACRGLSHLKEIQLEGNLFDFPHIWTVARLTYV